MTGRLMTPSADVVGRLPEQDLAQIVLEEKRLRHAQAGEEADDVPIEKDRLPAARGGIATMLQIAPADDDVFVEAGVLRLGGAEKREQRALGAQHARELLGQRLC